MKDPEENETSPENNSSIVLLLQIENQKLLFTGDVGVEGLSLAMEKAESLGIGLKTMDFFQVPHHGSKHNLGPTLLNKLIGEKLEEDNHIKSAFVSVPKEGAPKHPSGKVINALRRRGTRVFATCGKTILHKHNAPEREGWVTANPLDFFTQVAE